MRTAHLRYRSMPGGRGQTEFWPLARLRSQPRALFPKLSNEFGYGLVLSCVHKCTELQPECVRSAAASIGDEIACCAPASNPNWSSAMQRRRFKTSSLFRIVSTKKQRAFELRLKSYRKVMSASCLCARSAKPKRSCTSTNGPRGPDFKRRSSLKSERKFGCRVPPTGQFNCRRRECRYCYSGLSQLSSL